MTLGGENPLLQYLVTAGFEPTYSRTEVGHTNHSTTDAPEAQGILLEEEEERQPGGWFSKS